MDDIDVKNKTYTKTVILFQVLSKTFIYISEEYFSKSIKNLVSHHSKYEI